MAKKAWTSASAPPDAIAIRTPQTQLPVLSAPQMPQKAPISIMPSRPMFTTPERSERQRCGEDEHRGDQARSEDLVQVRGARAGGEHGEPGAQGAGRDRSEADPVGAAARRDDAEQDRDDADEDRPERRACGDGRDGEHEGDHAERHADRPDGGRLDQARARALHGAGVGAHDEAASGSGAACVALLLRCSFRREFQTARMSTSAPTKSTTRPWIISVRWPARLGSIVPDWRPCVVPYSRAPNRNAARPTPTAVFRPSRATAIPRKPIDDA